MIRLIFAYLCILSIMYPLLFVLRDHQPHRRQERAGTVTPEIKQKVERSLKNYFKRKFPNVSNVTDLIYQDITENEILPCSEDLALIIKNSSSQAEKSCLQDPLLHNHLFYYHLNNELLCQDQDIFIIIYIHSAVKNFKKRNLIRHSWGSLQKYKGKIIKHIFMIGQTYDNYLQERVKEEFKAHKDIIQGNFIDTYRNLTYKQISGLHWLSKYCSHAQFIIKTDDDVTINIPLVFYHLQNVNQTFFTDLMECKIGYTNVERDVNSKWYISKAALSVADYPQFCLGFGYITTIDVALKILKASKRVPFFWIDDVFVTGVLTKVAGVTREHADNFGSLLKLYLKGDPDKMFYIYQNPRDLQLYWYDLWFKIMASSNKYDNQ